MEEAIASRLAFVPRCCDAHPSVSSFIVHACSNNGFGLWLRLAMTFPKLAARLRQLELQLRLLELASRLCDCGGGAASGIAARYVGRHRGG